MAPGPVDVLELLVCTKDLFDDEIGPVDVLASADVCLLKVGPVEVLEVFVCVLENDEGGPGEVGVTGPVEVFDTFVVVVTLVLPAVGFTGLAKYVLLVLPKVGSADPMLLLRARELVLLTLSLAYCLLPPDTAF